LYDKEISIIYVRLKMTINNKADKLQ